MDKTADLYLKLALLEAPEFSIPGFGVFRRPSKIPQPPRVRWEAHSLEKPVPSLLSFLTENCNMHLPEAEAIHASIVLGLKHALNMRNQYYIPEAGTLKRGEDGNLWFEPEPATLKAWFPESRRRADGSPQPQASPAKVIAVSGFLTIAALIVISAFWVAINPSESQDDLQQEQIIAKRLGGQDSPAEAEEPDPEPLPESPAPRAESRPETDKDTKPILPPLPRAQGKPGSLATQDQPIDRDPRSLDRYPSGPLADAGYRQGSPGSTNPALSPATQNTRGSDEPTAGNDAGLHYLIVKSKANRKDADKFCASFEFFGNEKACSLLPMPNYPGLFRVAVFRHRDRSKVEERRAFLHQNGYGGAWILSAQP